MPSNWNWLKLDARNIRDIHKRFGSIPIRTHPLISVTDFIFYRYFRRIKWVSFLDFFDYRKEEAQALLHRKFGFRPYPYKHYESVFTRFYQGFILPEKFGVDKRKLHLSTLVMTGQMSREEALGLLSQSAYPDRSQEKEDHTFVLKKLGFTEESFSSYLNNTVCSHSDYASEKPLWDLLFYAYKKLRMVFRL